MSKKSTAASRAPKTPSPNESGALPSFAEAIQTYEQTLCDALEGGKTDAETKRLMDTNNRAIERLAKAPARTPHDLGEKLRILVDLLTDRNGHDGDEYGDGALLDCTMPDDRRAVTLLESLCRDVAAIDGFHTPSWYRQFKADWTRPDEATGPRVVTGTDIKNLEAFDRLTSRVDFVAASAETLRQGIEFGDVASGTYLHDAVATIAHLADEAKDALDKAFARPSVTP